jgi:hypothetical protein
MMRVSDEKVLCGLLQENECSDTSESECSSGSDKNVKISSCGEQSVSSDEEENASDNSSTQHCIWTGSEPERSRFPFTGKPRLNVDLEGASNPLEYFELFYTPQIAELIDRESNR